MLEAVSRQIHETPARQSAKPPIFVDLDGTLIRTDIFAESALRLLKANPLRIISLFGWLLHGRSVAKTMTARKTRLDPGTLPYNAELIAMLTRERLAGRRIYLATATHWKPARAIARHLGIFDDVLASSAHRNLIGGAKLASIQNTAQENAFTYGGDSQSDRPIWRAAESVILVDAPKLDVADATARGAIEATFPRQNSPWRELLRAMRPHQWSKNALLAVPLFTSHSYSSLSATVAAAIAIFCFSLCASGVYLLNDMLDIESDRRHPTKRLRPFARGSLGLRLGVVAAVTLPITALAISLAALPNRFSLLLLIYYVLTNGYSLKIKSISTLDVFTLSGLYTLRIAAGAVAIGVALSSWLALFSVFFFLSLAYLKRYCELYSAGDATTPGRDYSGNDKSSVHALGIASGFASTIVLALFVQSPEVPKLYASPNLLLLVCVGVLYWLNRAWVRAGRGKIHEDPVVFAFRDRTSRWVGAALVIVVLAAKNLHL